MPPISPTSFLSFSVPNDVNEVSFRGGFGLLRLLFLVNEVENEVFFGKLYAVALSRNVWDIPADNRQRIS